MAAFLCAFTKGPLSKVANYTTAILFMLHNINSSCQQVICWTQSDTKTKPVRISKYVLSALAGSKTTTTTAYMSSIFNTAVCAFKYVHACILPVDHTPTLNNALTLFYTMRTQGCID